MQTHPKNARNNTHDSACFVDIQGKPQQCRRKKSRPGTWMPWVAAAVSACGQEQCLQLVEALLQRLADRKSTRLNSSHLVISYAVFCLKKKKQSPLHIIT